MASKHARRRTSHTRSIESLEERRVMSADSFSQLLGGSVEQHGFHDLPGEPPALVHHHEQDPDFWIDSWSERDLETLLGNVEQTLSSAHGATGLTQVRNDYGFIGTGQTVAIIDSGIAWDHSALGGGFGAHYRVVGGWDFTEENDASPYDDGPSGSHGTHVTGIVGADAAGTNNDGVAPGVDLVGLRVFNDAGAGYFSWVENALQWIHQNRNAYENPITAVNLSLGTSWNSTTVPSWATLENEFAQLEADGIFITVSAGNSFATYNATGLSYPAASPYVVPVMSVTDSGNLSSFSQRHPSAIAAPGQYIVSTVPDYIGNQNGVNDDFASFSGTSMAAPYVAGASVIVREAMQFVGYNNITQDTIFNHMMATATTFFDAATSQNYKRLNLASALDALMPNDDYGSTIATAHNLGTLSGTSEIAGLIGKLSDADYFTFTAAATGTVSFTATTTHGLAPAWTASGGSGTVGGAGGETFTFDVTAGQTYTLGLSTTGGLGYYDLAIEAQSSFTYVDWGTITQNRVNNLSNAGETWYRIEAGRAGYLTVEASFSSVGGNIQLALCDSNLQVLASGTATSSGGRVDLLANTGTDYFLCVTGANTEINFQLTNLVSLDGTTVNVAGTSAADAFTFTAGATHGLSVNGVTYAFASTNYTAFQFVGGDGSDSITLYGTAGNETATINAGDAQLVGSGFSTTAASVANVTVYGAGGSDIAYLYDSAGDDCFYGYSNRVRLSGAGLTNEVWNFGRVYAYARQGDDKAYFYDTAGNDLYVAWSSRAYMSGTGYFNDARGFDRTAAYATAGGHDRAVLYDTGGDDTCEMWWNRTVISSRDHYNDARGFDRTTVCATQGYDRSVIHDSAGDDSYLAWSDRAVMYGDAYYNDVLGFDRMTGHATQGNDRAVLFDSTGDDMYVAWWNRAVMNGAGYYNDVVGFDRMSAHASQGNDRAVLFDSIGDDSYSAWSNRALMSGADFSNEATGFDRTTAHLTTGYDRAVLYDSAGNDSAAAMAWGAYLTNDAWSNDVRGCDEVCFRRVNGGTDTAEVQVVDYLFSLIGGWITA